jgi:CDP-L-myo-inositol myo-inositolphosphotransferase
MAFDSNARPAIHNAWRALIAPTDPAQLFRPIAGVSALSRQLIELAGAGVGEAVVLAEPPAGLAEAVQDDLRRAACGIEVRFQTAAPERQTDVLLLDGSALVRARALGRLMRRDEPVRTLTLADRAVARRLAPTAAVAMEPPEHGAAAAPAGQAISLQAVERVILRETSKASDGLVSRYLNRPVSRLLTGWLLRLPGIRPGHATILTALSAAAMFLALIEGRPASLAIGCLLFHLTSVVDGLDGEIARATFRTSRRGAALDTAVDMATNLAFALGLTVGLSRLYGEPYPSLGAFSFVGLAAGIAVMSLLVRRGPDSGSFDLLKTTYRAKSGEGLRLKAVKALQVATSRDFFAFVFALLGMAGQARAIAWILAFGVSLWMVIIAGGVSLLFAAGRPAMRR